MVYNTRKKQLGGNKMKFTVESKYNKRDILKYGNIYDIDVRVVDVEMRINHDIIKFFYLVDFVDGRREWVREDMLIKKEV